MTAIALIGDYSPDVTAHRAIPPALELARAALATDLTWTWLATRALPAKASDLSATLTRFSGIWVVPASPYENTEGALAAIRFARETRRPFLGTCGGFQHALIEFARNALALADADHAETNPHASVDALVVTRLACSLVEQTNTLDLAPDSLLHASYGTPRITEGYRCNYGPSARHRVAFERAGLRFTAFDSAGEVRAAELPPALHPFFAGTLFQPERAALRGELPPLVRSFAAAAVKFGHSPKS